MIHICFCFSISGVITAAKIADRIMAEYMIADMSSNRDRQQYGNEKGMSLNHLLIKLVNKILTAVDKNSAKEKFAVILTMLDWSQAFLKSGLISTAFNPSLTTVSAPPS